MKRRDGLGKVKMERRDGMNSPFLRCTSWSEIKFPKMSQKMLWKTRRGQEIIVLRIPILKPFSNRLSSFELSLTGNIGFYIIDLLNIASVSSASIFDWFLETTGTTEVHFTYFMYKVDRWQDYRVRSCPEPKYDDSDNLQAHLNYYALVFEWYKFLRPFMARLMLCSFWWHFLWKYPLNAIIII